MREPSNRAQRIPRAERTWRSLRRVAQRLDAVAVAIDRVPERHEHARFGEQEKEDAIDDRERLLEAVVK